MLRIVIAVVLASAIAAGAQGHKRSSSISQTSTGNNSPNIVGAGNVVNGQAAPAKDDPKPDTPGEVKPTKTMDSMELDLALARMQKLQLQAQMLQQNATNAALQQIEPQLAPLRKDFSDEAKIVTDEMAKVKAENKYGSDVALDQNVQSPTFGKWIKTPKPPEPVKK